MPALLHMANRIRHQKIFSTFQLLVAQLMSRSVTFLIYGHSGGYLLSEMHCQVLICVTSSDCSPTPNTLHITYIVRLSFLCACDILIIYNRLFASSADVKVLHGPEGQDPEQAGAEGSVQGPAL